MNLYRHMLRDEDAAHVPEPVEGLCGDRLLEHDLAGRQILFIVHRETSWFERSKSSCNEYVSGVVRATLFLWGYSWRSSSWELHGAARWIDKSNGFWCVRAFKSSFVKGVIDLYKALRDGDPTLAVHAYETWGFDNLSQEVIDVLNIWAEFVCPAS